MFHAQQAAEKSLKAFLTWHDIPFRKTHDLRELFDLCVSVDSSFETLRDPSEGLTPYAWRFRYPGGTEEPTRQEAHEALAIAQEVHNAVLARLPEEARP